MNATTPINKFLTALIIGYGIFHLVAPEKLQDQYGIDSLLGYPQKQCHRQMTGAVLLIFGIFLNTRKTFKLVETPSLPGYSLPSAKTEQFLENYANFPDYETFVI